MPILTDLDAFRLELGDIDSSAPLFNDDEAQYFLANASSVLLAVADACDALARRFAREFDFDANENKSFKRSQKAMAYAKMASELRMRAAVGGGLSSIPLTKVDAASDDLSTRDAAWSRLGRTGRVSYGFYNDVDEP